MTAKVGRVGSAETGSREPGLASRPGPAGFDPARITTLSKELGELRDYLKRNWDDVAKSEADAGWMGGWGIEERLNACMFVGKQTTMTVYQALDKIVAALASGIEAATAGETSTQIEGSTEGKSPTAKPGRPTPGSEA